jgi:hypothetical protein
MQPSQNQMNAELLSEAITLLRVFASRWEVLFDRDAGDGETWKSQELSDALDRADAVITKAEVAGVISDEPPPLK